MQEFKTGSTVTAFAALARELSRQLREAEVDHAAFETRLRRCDLSICRASCCHDGVMLDGEEVRVIGALLENAVQGRSDFPSSTEWLAEVNEGRFKTKARPAHDDEVAVDFPAHFKKSRCVFLDNRHKCALQSLSIDEGRHEWFYKPVGCWMHPVTLLGSAAGRDRPLLTLRTPANSSGPMTDFAACTHCGRPDEAGLPAYQMLREELEMLFEISGRDFFRELNARKI